MAEIKTLRQQENTLELEVDALKTQLKNLTRGPNCTDASGPSSSSSSSSSSSFPFFAWGTGTSSAGASSSTQQAAAPSTSSSGGLASPFQPGTPSPDPFVFTFPKAPGPASGAAASTVVRKPKPKPKASRFPTVEPAFPASSSVLYLHHKMVSVLKHRENGTSGHAKEVLEPMHRLVEVLQRKVGADGKEVNDAELHVFERRRQSLHEMLSASQAEIRQAITGLPPPKKADMDATLSALVEKRDAIRQRLRDCLLDILPAGSCMEDRMNLLQERLQKLVSKINELENVLVDCAKVRASDGAWLGNHVPAPSAAASSFGGGGPSVAEVTEEYDKWLSQSFKKTLQQATDAALAELHLYLQSTCLLLPSKVAASDTDVGRYWTLTFRANEAMDAEMDFYMGADMVSTFPVHIVLRGAQLELKSLRSEAESLTLLQQQLIHWQKECKSIETVISLLPECDQRIKTLIEARHELLEAQWALQDETIKFERAQHRGQVEDLGTASLSAAQLEVRQRKSALLVAAQTVLELESDFPELAWYIGASIPQAILPFWDSNRKLPDFENVQPLLGPSRNIVYQATLDGQRFAIKGFTTSGPGLQACLQEAGRLVRAAHPHIVEITALFQDPSTHMVYMQMPFYEGGTLDQWVEEQRPNTTSLRRIMLQVFSAVAHLHSLGIIHADLKPSNILICSKGRVRVGDFDVSVDEATRISTSYVTTRSMAVGFTPGFAAPELLKTGATKASDVFSLGAIVTSLPPSPDNTPQTEEQSRAFAAKLCHEDPGKRPTVMSAMDDQYFAPAIEWQRAEVRECCVMGSEMCDFGDRRCQLAEGVECSGANGAVHFICDGCLLKYATTFISEELRLQMRQEGHVWCPQCQCLAAIYDDTQLARHLPADIFSKYLGIRMQLLEKRQAEAHEQQFKAMLAAELQRLVQLDEEQRRVSLACRHIRENILNHRCPRCGQVYIDFDGCCALQCSHCPCAFCAWCGQDCGTNAHQHVANCATKPLGRDALFATQATIEEHHRQQRRQQMKAYLNEVDEGLRQKVMEGVQVNLQGLGLWPL